MNQINLDQLSDAAIKKLWQAKQAKDRQQLHDAERPALADMGLSDEGYYRDAFGNVIEGKKPTPKTVGHYVDASGYVQELAPGEKAPELSGNSLVDWLNNQDVASDPELRAALGADNLFFEEHLRIGDSDVWLIGRLESNGWLVTSRSEDRNVKDLRFRLAKNLTRNEAIEQAATYVAVKSGPQFRNLSEAERRMCERMAIGSRLDAFVFYVTNRLPEHMADMLLQLDAAGNELGVQQFCAQEQISEIAEEAVIQTHRWNNVRADHCFLDFVAAHSDGRLITFSLLDALFNQYTLNNSVDRLGPEQMTQADVVEMAESMSDEELAATITEATKLRSQRR